MSVLSINFFVLRRNIDFEVSISLPLLLVEFNFCNFFTEDGLADDGPEEAVTYVLILFVLIHEVAEEDGEVDDIEEKRLHSHLK